MEGDSVKQTLFERMVASVPKAELPTMDVGIMFSAPMVRALLNGSKTQTRRLASSPLARCRPGDRLWVRESWACHWATDDQKPREIDQAVWSVRYFADDHVRPALCDGNVAEIDQCKKRRAAMFMMRWMSRLTLIVENVVVEPLVSISDADALAEGVHDAGPDIPSYRRFWLNMGPDKTFISAHPAECYARIWADLHTAEGQRWSDNPDVVALTFRVVRENIDRISA